MVELEIVAGLLLLLVGATATAIYYAKRATKEKQRADLAEETSKVALALAEPVAPAKDKTELKERSKKRRDRADARRKHGGK